MSAKNLFYVYPHPGADTKENTTQYFRGAVIFKFFEIDSDL